MLRTNPKIKPHSFTGPDGDLARCTECRVSRERHGFTAKERPKKEMSKTDRYDRIRAILKTIFASYDVTRCEARIQASERWPKHLCRPWFGLGFAHSKKRRELTDEELCTDVILACADCHDLLDLHMTHDEMYGYVQQVVNRRIPYWKPVYQVILKALGEGYKDAVQ